MFRQVNVAMYHVLDRAPNSQRPSVSNIRIAISILTFTAIVFRAELVLLLAPFTIYFLYHRYIDFVSVLKVGIITGIASVGMSLVALKRCVLIAPSISSNTRSRFLLLESLPSLARVRRNLFQRLSRKVAGMGD